MATIEPSLLPLPIPDRDSAPYWAALAVGRFLVQHCRSCGSWTWPCRPMCSGCHGEEMTWEEPSGDGCVVTWVVTHQPYSPRLAHIVPYTIVLVRLDEQDDILIPGRYVSDVDVTEGLRVRVLPERLTDDIGVVTWTVRAQ
ncbi:MAG: Zn-ribbon domain-containing OB-fold protein [Acidimicrobiales bacterium]